MLQYEDLIKHLGHKLEVWESETNEALPIRCRIRCVTCNKDLVTVTKKGSEGRIFQLRPFPKSDTQGGKEKK